MVGTLLFVINQLDVVMSGDATPRTWVKAASTYVVPFCVANYGVLTATRHRPTDRATPSPEPRPRLRSLGAMTSSTG